jgi:UDP:flavonoid glycosyltransferase YjiC (YdhE family)
VAAWVARFNKIRPYVLIIDHSPTAMLANRVSKISSIATGTGFTVPPLRAPMRPLRYWQLREPAELLRSERKVLDISNAVLRRFDGRALDALSDLISCDAAWLLSFPELDHYGIRDGAQYYGNFPVQEHGRAPRWKDHDVPKVFAYLTASHVPGEFASAIRDMSANLLLFAPNLVPGEEERFVASRTERSRFPLDLELVARQCDAAVTNGGLNTVSAFFRGGTPQLVLADNLECYMVGRRLEITGAGLLNFASSERALSLKLRAVLTDRSISRNASRFAIKYQSANSHTQLADMLADIAALAVSLS